MPSTNIVGVSAGDRHFLSREPALVNVVSGYAKTDVVANPLYWLNVSLWRKSTDGKLEAWSDYEGILEYKSVDPHWHGWGSRDFKDGKSEEFVFRGAGLYRFVLPRKVEEKWMIENPDFRIPNKEPEIRLVVVPKSPLPETAIVVVAADKGNPVAGAKVRIRAFPEDIKLTADAQGRATAALKERSNASVQEQGYIPVRGQVLELGKVNRIELKPDRMIEGTVIDNDGAALAGASVEFASWRGPPREIFRTDEQGRFLLGTGGRERGMLIVSAPGYPRSFVPVQAREMRTRTDVRLEKGLEIRLALHPELARVLRTRGAAGRVEEKPSLWLHLRDAETGDMAVETEVTGHEAGPFWVRPGRYDLFCMFGDMLAHMGTYEIRKNGAVECSLTVPDETAFRSAAEVLTLFGRPYHESPEAWQNTQSWPDYLAAHPEVKETVDAFVKNFDTWMQTQEGRRKALQWFDDNRDLVRHMPAVFEMNRIEQELRKEK